jgi:hypothetical protein
MQAKSGGLEKPERSGHGKVKILTPSVDAQELHSNMQEVQFCAT